MAPRSRPDARAIPPPPTPPPPFQPPAPPPGPTKGRAMLTLCDAGAGPSRRGFLTVGTLGLAGLPLSSLLAASSSEDRPSHVTGKSIIFLFQQGGPVSSRRSTP